MKSRESIVHCFNIIFKANPLLSSLEGISYLGSAIITGVAPLVWEIVFDGITVYTSGGTNRIYSVLIVMAIYVLCDYVFRIIGRISTRYFSYNERLVTYLKGRLIRHAGQVPYELLYDEAYYGIYMKALQAIESGSAMDMINLTYQIPALLLGVVIATAALYSFAPILVLLCIASFLPALAIHRIRNQRKQKSHEKMLSMEKRRNYLWELFFSPDSVADIKIHCLHDRFKERYASNNNDLVNEKSAYAGIDFKTNICINIIRTLGYAVCIGILSMELYQGHINISIFGAGIATFTTMQSIFERFIDNIGRYDDVLRFYDDFESFMNLPEDARQELPSNKLGSITLDNVSYHYPGERTDVIRNVNLTIKKGESVAIVGENGAGKTTMVNLICGLFRPSGGVVRVVDSENHETYGGTIDFTATFQNYVRYFFTIRENIGLSDWQRIPETVSILDAIHVVENDEVVDRIGLDGQLGASYNGSELSGGEWQRLAIGRCLFRNRTVCVFDEPTAQIDPLMEETVFRQFLQLSKSKTSILVTHRIGAAKLCERIVVLQNGHIVEDGSHEDLISQNGIYAKLHRKQAIWYT